MIPAGYTLRFLAWPIGAWVLGVQVVAYALALYFSGLVDIQPFAYAGRLPWAVWNILTPGGSIGAWISLAIVVLGTTYSRGKRLNEPSDPELAPDASPVGRMNQEHRKLSNVFRAFIRSQKKSRLDHLVRPRAAGFFGFVMYLLLLQFPFAVGDWILGKFWELAWPRRRMPRLPRRSGGDDLYTGAGPDEPFDPTAPSNKPQFDADYLWGPTRDTSR